MKNQNKVLTVTLVALAFACAPVVQAERYGEGGPTHLRRANEAPTLEGGPVSVRVAPVPRTRPTPAQRPDTSAVNRAADEASSAESEESSANSGSSDVRMPVISVHAIDNVIRGKTGAFVLEMKPRLMLGGMYVNFSVGGTAVEGIDYVAVLSPAYIGQSGYGLIQIQTLPNPRGSALRQAYSVVITLEDGAGYALGKARSATMWIKP